METWVEWLHRFSLASRDMPVPARYGITFVVSAAVTLALRRSGLGAEHYAYLVYIPIILAAAAVLDRGNGVFATLLGAAACASFALSPGAPMTGSDRIALALFIVTGLAISLVVEALHTGLVEVAAQHEMSRLATRERNLLLGELAHRTRNDLASVVTLLQLQSRTANAETKVALSAAADRVHTIARVHRRLELRHNRVVVDSKTYIEELCADLRMSLLAMRPIALDCVTESHLLGVEKIVPLGLIINESITNAAKHAFPGERSGTITVEFTRKAPIYRLSITDDGVGADGEVRAEALGGRLMQLLAGQLGTRIVTSSGPGGTVVSVDVAIVKASESG